MAKHDWRSHRKIRITADTHYTPVNSINGHTGIVSIDASDINININDIQTSVAISIEDLNERVMFLE